MIVCPVKRIYGLLGAPRSGKDQVAKFLEENRGFKRMAFGNKIKEEFGVSKVEFEEAKITGKIDKLREDLWKFSASKKKDDPLYFVRQVIQDAHDSKTSVVITDIRTQDEWDWFFEAPLNHEAFKRTFMVCRGSWSNQFVDDMLIESEFRRKFIWDYFGKEARVIFNMFDSLYELYRSLDQKFFNEDIIDMADSEAHEAGDYMDWRNMIIDYVRQFNIEQL